MSRYRRWERLPNVPRQRYSGEVIEFSDADGTLKTVDEDGTVATVGSGGGGGAVPFVGVDPPGSPTDGMLWWDPDDDTAVGGSQPGTVRMLDLGTVAAADLAAGPVTLYEWQAGEIIGPVLLDPGNAPWGGSSVAFRIGGATPGTQAALTDLDTAIDSNGLTSANAVGMQAAPFDDGNSYNYAPLLTEDVLAAFTNGLAAYGPGAPWAPMTVYPVGSCVIGSDGHLWKTDDGGTSGNSEPDFAGNEGDSVDDNGITWDDVDVLTTDGEIHVYAYVTTPDTP